MFIVGALVIFGAVAVAALTVFGGSSGPKALEDAKDFHDVLADHGIDCDQWENYGLDDEYSEAIFDLTSFSGTISDAGSCTLDESDLVSKDEYLYGDTASLVSTDVYVFRSESDAEQYASLMKRNGCGDDGDSFMIVNAKSWIAVLEFDGSDKLPKKVAGTLGAEWSRVAC